jgi:voltage-gated potassium channel
MVFKSKLYKALFFLLIILAVGFLGYLFLFDFTIVNAIYMTVITISTVGFSEVVPLTDEGKIFTIFLILTSISVFGYAVSAFSEALASGDFFKQIKLKRVQRKIDKLKNHTIVCGYGRNGMQAIVKLKNYQKEFVVIEKNKELIKVLDEESILYIEGDATTDEALNSAGIINACNLITALPSDADNLFVVLTASQLNKGCKIISRASNESSYSKLKIAGANNVIMPDKLGGAHMASLVVTPDVLEFVDRLTIEGETTANLEEVSVNDLPKIYLDKTILDLDLRKKTGCNVIGYKKVDGSYIINPEISIKLVADSSLIVLGRPEQIVKLRELF